MGVWFGNQTPVLVRLSIWYGPIEMIPIPLFILVRKYGFNYDSFIPKVIASIYFYSNNNQLIVHLVVY